MRTKLTYLIFFVFVCATSIAQTAAIKGTLRNTERKPIEGVSITYEGGTEGTVSDAKGNYSLTIPAKLEVFVVFSHVTYNKLYKKVKVPKNKTIRYSPIMTLKTEEINEVTIQDRRKEVQGFTTIKKSTVKKIPGANPGVENLLMTFAGG